MFLVLRSFLAVLLLFAASFTGCVLSAAPEAERRIVRAVYGEFYPYNFTNDQGDAAGYSVDLLRQLAQTAGYEVEFTKADNCAELTPASPPDPENALWLAEIEQERNSVSLHVRRGDYVRNLKFAAHHGSCTPEYYARALEHVTERMGTTPVIYVFADEPDWVVENMPLPGEVKVIRHNDAARNYEDIRLMSACRHHIIANSSFSWWGAWMNPRADKIVAAPDTWFADPASVNPDIWAQGWTRIKG
mgnify:CR=1 FL=1